GVFVVVTTDTGTPASSTASANVGLARESMSSHSSAMLMLLSCAATTIPYDPTAVGGSPVPQDPLALVIVAGSVIDENATCAPLGSLTDATTSPSSPRTRTRARGRLLSAGTPCGPTERRSGELFALPVTYVASLSSAGTSDAVPLGVTVQPELDSVDVGRSVSMTATLLPHQSGFG